MLAMNTRQGVDMLRLSNPRNAVPTHYNDYTVFKSPLEDLARAVEAAKLTARIVYLRHGETY
jgi:L-ascorbate metabolism protein UlaG (beta-lactamase superfamily)